MGQISPWKSLTFFRDPLSEVHGTLRPMNFIFASWRPFRNCFSCDTQEPWNPHFYPILNFLWVQSALKPKIWNSIQTQKIVLHLWARMWSELKLMARVINFVYHHNLFLCYIILNVWNEAFTAGQKWLIEKTENGWTVHIHQKNHKMTKHIL